MDQISKILIATLFALSFSFSEDQSIKEQFISDLLEKMTLEEKIGQMNQYSSFFDVTGPPPEDNSAKNKYDYIRTGMVGSVLNVKGPKDVRAMQE